MASELDRLQEQYERIRQRRLLFENLLASPEWAEYRNAIEALIMTNQTQVMTQPETLDGSFAMTSLKGKVRGLIEALEFPINAVQAYLRDEQENLAQQEAAKQPQEKDDV